MPTKSRREDAIIEHFVSAYEGSAWKNSQICWLDHVKDGAVDALVTRSDGKTLAIEHTLIESFVGEREDFEGFKRFLRIEDDPALRQTDRIVCINVPRNVLPKSKSKTTSWDAIVRCVQRWLQANLAQLGEGEGYHYCPVAGHRIAKPFTIKLHIKIISSEGSVGRPLIRRYGSFDVDATVEKALLAKLPKLANTAADFRILLLERNQWSLDEKQIWQAIHRRAAAFPLLSKIDEIWFAETVFYDALTDPNWCGYLCFNQYAGDDAQFVAEMAFLHGKLIEMAA